VPTGPQGAASDATTDHCMMKCQNLLARTSVSVLGI